MAAAYPLEWPRGWPRSGGVSASRFELPTGRAYEKLRAELHRMGAEYPVISTNIPIKADGTPRLDREPVDSGVAVYFRRKGRDVVFACDKYDVVRDNFSAIAKTLEALRGIERWGAGELLDRAYSGFAQLPEKASEGEDCWQVLGLAPMSEERLVRLSHRDLVRKLHADGADSESMARVNVARDNALAALKGGRE
jgi:hypothetical protein